MTVNHMRRILSTAKSCPSRMNDKTVILYDEFMTAIRAQKLYENVTYELYDANGVPHVFSGAWIMVDNGYLSWSCTVPPMKQAHQFSDIRWSKWMESMRKDVECTFGIMKGRWRILKTG